MSDETKTCYANTRKFILNSKKLTDPPIAMDLSRKMSKIFDLKSRKNERISEYMCKNIRQTKLKALKKVAKIDVIPSVSRHATSKDFRAFAEKCLTTQMSRFQEKYIREKIQARGLENQFPQIVDDIMKDTKLEYQKITHYAGINLKVKDKYPEKGFRVERYKFLGRTENYHNFLYLRRKLKNGWILHYGIMRRLLEECVLCLPYELFAIKIDKVVDLEDLQYIFREKIQYTAAFLHDFYKKVSAILDKAEGVFKKRQLKLLPAGSGLFSVHVSRCIAHTMRCVVKFTESVNIPPFLKLYVDFDAGLLLTPTAKEITDNFCKFLDDIISAAEELYVLEKGRIRGYETKTISLCLTEEFIIRCKKDIADNIFALYEPVMNYLEKLGTDFRDIYSDITSEKFLQSISDILFENGCQKIQYYKNFIHKVAYIPDNEYFKLGQLILKNYREKLHNSLQMISDSIFKNLSLQHLWEVNDICDRFLLIKIRATQKPITTEELIEIGRFMTWVREEHLESLSERINTSLALLCNIITLGLLDEDHMAANSAAINWLDDILPIVEQHLLNYEQLKFEAEEKLQKVIEDINVLITAVYPLLVILDEMDNIKLVRKYLHDITLHMTKIKEIYQQIEWINNEEVCLSFPKSNYAEFENLKDYVYPFYHLLKLCLDVQKRISVWQYGQFDLLDYESTHKVVDKFSIELTELQKNYKKKLRQAQDENLPVRFKGTVDDPDLLNWPAPLKLCATASKILEEFRPSLQVMKIMCNDALRQRHWKAMSEIAGFNLTPNAGTTLKKMMEFDLKEKLEEYEIISTGATKEQQLLDNLKILEKEWKTITLTIIKTKDDISILTRLEDIGAVVDDHMIKVLNMRGSVFVKPHEKNVLKFYDTILKITSVVTNWKVIQADYLKLFPIFSIEDVSKHIPNKKAHFEECDNIFKLYISKIEADPRVTHIVCNTKIVEDLDKSLIRLEEVQKGVIKYLEIVRRKCPRLYYISNEELVNLIAKNGDLSEQTFLVKIFPGISSLKFINSSEIAALISSEAEEVALKNTVNISSLKNLDQALNALENEMVNTVKYRCAECYKIFKKTDIRDLVKKFPQQSLQLMAQVFWTDQVESALKLTHNIKLLIYKKKLEENIEAKIKMINENDITNKEKVVVKNVLLVDLNNKYLLGYFFKDGTVVSDQHFDWQVQLRFYFEKSLCTVKILQNSLSYGYEYLGNSGSIILTPMTDKCFRTLLNAHFLKTLGLIRGKSETGKSVTFKGLAETLGMLCFSFTCSKTISFHVIEQILKGTVLCGAWLALENLEYVQPNVFSVISQELLSILDTKKQQAEKVLLGQMLFDFNPRCFICGIVNLETKLLLPENLRVMLRTFTLCKPDLEILAETLLITQGVKDSRVLAKKLKSCFSLLADLLSFQKQYSFGLSNLRNVLSLYENDELCSESERLCRSIDMVIGNSLVESDRRIFYDILYKVFHVSTLPKMNEKQDVIEQVKITCHQLNLFLDEEYTVKLFDVYNILKSKHNILLVGSSFTGKTTILKLCANILGDQMNKEVPIYFINPKCLSNYELIGQVSPVNNEWTDGVLLNILRQLNTTETRSTQTWINFDGHIDSSWIDSFPELLEKRRIFLESQEILLVNQNVSFIFEVTDLKDCSPLMVSRCGIIFFPSRTLKWTLLIDYWINSCQSHWLVDHKNQIESLFKWFVLPCLEALKTLQLKTYFEFNENALVNNTLTYFQLILDDATSKVNRKDEDPKNMPSWIHATFLQAGIYGLSSFLNCSAREMFDKFYKQLWKGQNPKYPYPNGIERLEVGIPHEGMLFEYCYLYKQRGTWKVWMDLLKNEKIVEHQYLNSYVIPTVDTMRCNFLLDLHIKYNRRFLIVGPRGTGKSLALKECFVNRLKEEEFETSVMTFNTNLKSDILQSRMLSKLNKRKAGHYTPSADRRFIFFIDDIHCSQYDSFGVSSVNELLRQHLDHKTWYDLQTFDKVYFDNTNFIASMETGYKHSLLTRFLRHFNTFGINDFTTETITKIFSQSLLHSWKKAGFPSDILTAINQIVSATLKTFQQVRKNLKPTLSKSHYVFDLTSISKVIYGCSFLKKESYDANKKIYLKLWVHEMMRLFGDRFDIPDIRWLSNHLTEAISEQFSENFEEIFGSNYDGTYPFSKLFFGTFNEKHLGNGVRHYDEVNFQNLTEQCVQCLKEYNEKQKFKLDMIFFDYALAKLARICRILSMPNENALLLGLTGCGRQSLTKFASFMYNYEFYQPVMVRKYDLNAWNQDLKNVFKRCGGMEKQCVFLISEEDIIDENFFEVLDYFIRDGEITDLYTLDEKQEILELTRLSAQGGNRNLDISSHKVFLYFNKKCRENLHIFLCLNSGSNNLRRRTLKYPSLVDRLNVILWKDWPDTSLEVVANFWIQNLDLPDEIKEKTIETAIYFHRTCQDLPELKNFVTPKAYIHLSKLFSDLIGKKQKMLTSKKERFLQGLAKLSYASTQISNMQKALAEYQPQLEAMTLNAIEMTKEIAMETIQVEHASALVRKDEKIASEQAIVAQVLKSECESELAQAIPILEDAISALNTLKPSDITLVKSMKNPPDAIKLVMASVCVIKDVKPDRIPDPSTGRKTIDYWGPSKRILGDMNFLQTLKDFDKDHIKPEVMVKIRKEYLPHKDFKPHVVAKASSAAEGLCKWIIAMDMYDRVAKEVAPKKEKLNKAEREYAETMRVLNEKKGEVMRIEEKLAQLNVLLDEATKKQSELQIEVDLCNKKLNSAQKLIGGLSGEKLRWTEASENLQKHFNVLAGDILLSSGIVAYLAPVDDEVRSKVIKNWRDCIKENQIPSSEVFNFTQVLSNEVECENWQEFGLPMDSFYTENAIIFNNSKYFCLFFDPQGLAVNWILKTAAGSQILVTKFTFKNWLSDVKYCISAGKPILVKDTKGRIPPCLYPLLYDQKFVQNGSNYVTIDDEDIKINSKFRIYIVCTKTRISYNLELKSRLTVINFSLTNTALTEDLLKVVVEIERPEIKKLTKKYIIGNRENKAALKDLEVKILDTLCESDADILEDEESILILDKSKDLAKNIMEKQEETKKIDAVIKDFKQGYSIVARYATNLFFCANDLQKLLYLYQFSLEWFKNLYFMSIIYAGKSKILQTRCQNLCDTFSYDLYKSINKGLFEKDKLLFTLWLACGVAISKEIITKREVLLFMGQRGNVEVEHDFEKPGWVSDLVWMEIQKIEHELIFNGFLKSFTENSDAWKEYFNDKVVEMPAPWNKLNEFGKLILLKIFRPEKLYYGIIDFVKSSLGNRFLKPIFLDMQEIYNESYSLAPILFVLTPGVNVLKTLHNFAHTKRVLHKFRHLCLGDKSYLKAEELIREGQKEGCWVLLENCQFQKEWLYHLEQLFESFDVENTHENFRLFLTSEPYNDFPLDVIQNSIKIVDEPPNILGKNLLRMYKKIPIITDDFFYGCPGKQDIFSKILYSFCHFHFVLQERQKISNWNVPYRFEETDLLVSLEQLRNIVNEELCMFDKIYSIIGECNYNAYLENSWEKRFVSHILVDCVNRKMFVKGNLNFNESKQYCLPTKNDRQDYLNHISTLPSQDDPQVLYLSEYEFLKNKLIKTKAFLESGLKMVQNTHQEYDLEGDEFRILSILDDIIQVVPKEVTRDDIEGLNDHIVREIQLYNKLLHEITYSMRQLRYALGGDCKLTEDYDEMAKDLAHNRLPEMWRRFSYPTVLNLANFIKDLIEKVKFFATVTNDNTQVWLGAFFFPKSVISSVKITFSKEIKASVDTVTLENNFLSGGLENSKVKTGIVVNNLFILGAKYDADQDKIVELSPKTYYDVLAPLWIKPVALTDKDVKTNLAKFKCCIFKTEVRPDSVKNKLCLPGCKNYVDEICLSCECNGSKWVRRGVSIVCEIGSV